MVYKKMTKHKNQLCKIFFLIFRATIQNDFSPRWAKKINFKMIITQVLYNFFLRNKMFYYIYQEEVVLFLLFCFFTLTLLGLTNKWLCSNYINCLHNSVASIKLNLILAPVWKRVLLWRISQAWSTNLHWRNGVQLLRISSLA